MFSKLSSLTVACNDSYFVDIMGHFLVCLAKPKVCLKAHAKVLLQVWLIYFKHDRVPYPIETSLSICSTNQ